MRGESEYVEGALYRATVGSEQGVLLWHADPGTSLPWLRLDRYSEMGWLQESRITETTGPLRVLGPDERVVEPGQVVLDLAAYDRTWCDNPASEAVRRIAMDDVAPGLQRNMLLDIARQIAEQTKPPRIPEPGWSAVVEASVEGREGRSLFASYVNGGGHIFWRSQDGRTAVQWDSLVDPVVKREAVES